VSQITRIRFGSGIRGKTTMVAVPWRCGRSYAVHDDIGFPVDADGCEDPLPRSWRAVMAVGTDRRTTFSGQVCWPLRSTRFHEKVVPRAASNPAHASPRESSSSSQPGLPSVPSGDQAQVARSHRGRGTALDRCIAMPALPLICVQAPVLRRGSCAGWSSAAGTGRAIRAARAALTAALAHSWACPRPETVRCHLSAICCFRFGSGRAVPGRQPLLR
jgi:hypothetical protein